jgi:hypothetical protein
LNFELFRRGNWKLDLKTELLRAGGIDKPKINDNNI